MDPKVFILEFTKHLDLQFWNTIFAIICVAIAILLLKAVAENISSFIFFRFDKNIAVGTPIEVYGKKGKISGATWVNITVETEDGFIQIPTKEWKKSRFIILKDWGVLRNRRFEDTKLEEKS